MFIRFKNEIFNMDLICKIRIQGSGMDALGIEILFDISEQEGNYVTRKINLFYLKEEYSGYGKHDSLKKVRSYTENIFTQKLLERMSEDIKILDLEEVIEKAKKDIRCEYGYYFI